MPSLQALSREGEAGRNRIQLYTHWLAVPMAIVQGYSQLLILQQLGAVSGIGFTGPNALPTLRRRDLDDRRARCSWSGWVS